jgi:ABC-type xylose transport system substrate-binding protein
MRKIFCALFIGLILICISCNKHKVRIGYLSWNAKNEIESNTLKFFQEKANEFGIEVLYKDASNDEKLQYTQALDLMDQGVKVLIIKPVNSITAAEIVRIAHAKNIIVIANDQLIKNCNLDYFVSFDSRKVGEYMAREALQKKPEGSYVLLWGDRSDENALLVRMGVLNILQPQIDNGKINILYSTYIEDWSFENAEYEFDMMVRLSGETKIDAVISSYDGMTRGAIKVLKKYNLLGNTFLSGQNAEEESLELILQNEQTMTIAKSPKTTGYALAELSSKLALKSNLQLKYDINGSMFNGLFNVPSILFDPVVINKLNL